MDDPLALSDTRVLAPAAETGIFRRLALRRRGDALSNSRLIPNRAATIGAEEEGYQPSARVRPRGAERA
jgi:methylphosphotriester-DNA--protein-cysteine methyltransferase